jgi:hypothetical protein
MKTITKQLILLAFFTSLLSFSQTDTKELSLDKGTINNQFDYVITKSSRFENYKVIKYSWINKLKSHVNDSISKLKSELKHSKQEIVSQKQNFENLQKELENVNAKLTDTTKAKDSINLIGLPLKKSLYKTIVWSIVSLLSIGLFFFVYQFKNSNEVTKRTLLRLDELEDEFNNSKTRALEREQVLNRKLQDEVNKQKKN